VDDSGALGAVRGRRALVVRRDDPQAKALADVGVVR
jgi:hypothetical protein